MTNWTENVIVAVRHSKEPKHIEQVKMMKYNGGGKPLSDAKFLSKQNVVSLLANRIPVITAANPPSGGWETAEVRLIHIDGVAYLRTEPDDIEEDNLGELPEF